MKIAEAIYSDTMGGSEVLGLALAQEFQGRGHQCDMLTIFTGDGSFLADLKASERNLHAANFHGSSLAKRLIVPVYLYNLFRREKYDVIHCHHMAVFFHCLRPARLAGIPTVVVTEHAHQHFSENVKLTQRSRSLGPKADTITVIHQELQDFFANDIGISADKLALIRNGINTDLNKPGTANTHVKNRVESLDKEKIVGCVSRLHPDKDVTNLVRAFHELKKDTELDVGLVIVGDGADRDKVETLIAQYDLAESVLLAGVQTNVVDWMRTFDVFALPSRREGVPLAILEAMACGLPVVATAVGGVPEIVDTTVGLTVPRENPQAFANALELILGNDSHRRSLAENAQQRARDRYSFANMVDQYLEVFQR